MKRIVTLVFLISMLLTACGEASTPSSAPQDVYRQDLPSPTELPTESPITNDGVPVFEDPAVSPEPAVVSCEEGSHTGTVKWFNSTKGYGFITSDEGNDVYVHYSAILVEGYPTLEEGQMVKFCLEDGPNGPQATHVEVLNP